MSGELLAVSYRLSAFSDRLQAIHQCSVGCMTLRKAVNLCRLRSLFSFLKQLRLAKRYRREEFLSFSDEIAAEAMIEQQSALTQAKVLVACIVLG